MSTESRVKFNHETAEKETQRPNYAAGQHYFVVTAAAKQMSKEKPEAEGVSYKMLKLTLKPVRDPNDITTVVGRGINSFNCLPFWDESWDELDYEVQTKEGSVHIKKKLDQNMTIFNEGVRDLLAALVPDEVPSRPRRTNKDSPYIYKGEEIDADGYKEANTESKAVAGDVAERLWNEGPEELIGKGCFGLIKYNEGSAWPELKAVSAEQLIDFKTGEAMDLVDPDSIMAAQSEEASEDAEEKPAKTVSKSNGAAGKPKASKATVAAASKLKVVGKGAAKGARR